MRETQRRHKAANAKARSLQNWIRDTLLYIYPGGQYESREMGQPGTDIKDPHYTLPFEYLDAKNWAKYPSLNKVIDDMNGKGVDRWVAVLKQTDGRKSVPYVLMNWDTFQELVTFYLWQNQYNRERQEEKKPLSKSAVRRLQAQLDGGKGGIFEPEGDEWI